MITTEPPLTWVDIARRLAAIDTKTSSLPTGLIRARIDWDGVVLEFRPPEPSLPNIKIWLEELFPKRVRAKPLALLLEGPPHAQVLPVSLVVEDTELPFRPAFGVVDGAIDFRVAQPYQRLGLPVPIAAVQSVKGGTGRTTTAIALSLRWSRRVGKPILLVDADLEAPGISYLFRETQREPRISLEDVIALAHAEASPSAPDTLSFVAEKLKDHAIGNQIVVLPLRRSLDELASSAVRPEHLSTIEHPFGLADLLASIAKRCGCSGVVVDVRAGLVPIGVNLGLDPEVAPVLVTTLSDQALQATGALVSFLTREIRRFGGRPRPPLLVVNRVPSVFQQAGIDNQLLEPLLSGIVEDLLRDQSAEASADEPLLRDALDLDPITVVKVPELPDLQVSSRKWESFVDQLDTSGFARRLSDGVDQWLDAELGATDNAKTTKPLSPAPTLAQRREKLADFAGTLISAENVSGAELPKPLITQALSALADRFRSEVPIAISEGAKGTGKTLNARFLVAQRTWNQAVLALGNAADAVPAILIPVCASIQASAAVQAAWDEQRGFVAKELNLNQPQTIYDTTSWLRKEHDPGKARRPWVDKWLDVIAWSAGFEPKTRGAGDKFIAFLRDQNRSAVAIFEGLEELYPSTSSPGVSEMMRGILVDLPQRLRSEATRPLGVIAFARRDTIEAAVPQNLDQYRREYAPFALSWIEDDVLELAAWLATRAEALPDLWSSTFKNKPQAEKANALEQLWGRKLGPDDAGTKRTREAYTATWVIAVLSDLQGRLVPRDLVRLLANAAKTTASQEEDRDYPRRLLTPRSLKDAVDPTSTAKVQETEEEINELKPIFAKFRRNPDQVVAPIDSTAVDALNLSRNDVKTLRKHGIVFGEAPPFEVPELFRRGLRLRHSGARHSVVNLYRRARQRLGSST